MNWFKKSYRARQESQHKEQRHRRIKKTPSESESSDHSQAAPVDLSKTLSSLVSSSIEIVDPDVFFQDPEHVHNYKEEAKFLRIMSEWVIIEHPTRHDSDNYFSADFEDELWQFRTQQDNPLPSLSNAASSHGSSQLSAIHGDFAEMTVEQQLQMDIVLYIEEQQQQMELQRKCTKRKLCQIFFNDNIQNGLILPMHCASKPEKRMQEEQTPAQNFTTTSKRAKLHLNVESLEDAELSNSPKSLESPSVDGNQIIKDCSIDRRQQKTDALARSIMGAIGKCPSKDGSPKTSLNDLNKFNIQTTLEVVTQNIGICVIDRCHISSGTFDHYDIKKFFQLDDSGNIRLNISHIVEHKGFGFAVAQNKRLYRRYLKGVVSVDESFAVRQSLLEIFKQLLMCLWNFLTGHPRNKISPYSSAGPGETIRAYTLQLAEDNSSTFSRNIENFISCTKESREAAPQVVMRNMRQFMNGMKNYLVKHGEGKFLQEVEIARERLKSDEFLNLDAILETVMHQLVVLPLREHLYGMFVDYYTRSEDIQLLAENVKYACGRSASDFGIRPTVTPPSTSSLQVISNLLLRLQEAELPLDKLDLFLCVISTVFDATGCIRGQQLGADDFLPVLVYVVAKCGFVGAEIEAEFMWGLLQPTLLNGEPGYYLTALCSAVHVLKSFMASEKENGTGSLDWRSSSLPASSSVLRVIIPDECNGSLQTRTLPVRPHTTTREVCRIIAHKARITNPQDYALFKLVDGEETILTDIECPQDIRLAAKGKHCMLAYKRIDAKIAWPTATQPVLN